MRINAVFSGVEKNQIPKEAIRIENPKNGYATGNNGLKKLWKVISFWKLYSKKISPTSLLKKYCPQLNSSKKINSMHANKNTNEKAIDCLCIILLFLNNNSIIDNKKIQALIKKIVAIIFSIKPSGVGAPMRRK